MFAFSHRALGGVWLLGLALLTAPLNVLAEASPVAMVTDLVGKANRGGQPIDILAYLNAGDRVSLEAGGSLVIVYLADSTEYRVTGPSRVQIGEQAAQVQGGSSKAKALNMAAATGPLHQGDQAYAQAALVLRNVGSQARIQPISPDDTRVFATQLKFAWQGIDSAQAYRFVLSDVYGETVHEQLVAGTTLALPKTLKLEEDGEYAWSVEARAADGKAYTSPKSNFSIATASDIKILRRLAARARSGFSEHVLYASVLEQRGFKALARAEWKKLADKRPESSAIRDKLAL